MTHSNAQTIFTFSGKEDAANNFARGHYTVGKEVIDMVGQSFFATIDIVNTVNKTDH